MDLQWLKIGDVNCHQINSSLIRPSLYKRNNTFYNQKNNSLHFNLNDSIDRRSQSRGILSLIEWSRLTREFIPTLVLLLLLVLKVVWREVKIWLKLSSMNSTSRQYHNWVLGYHGKQIRISREEIHTLVKRQNKSLCLVLDGADVQIPLFRSL